MSFCSYANRFYLLAVSSLGKGILDCVNMVVVGVVHRLLNCSHAILDQAHGTLMETFLFIAFSRI